MYDVYTYIRGKCKQLESNEETEARVSKKITSFNTKTNNKVYKICCGGMHTLVLTTTGRVYSWGNNDDKALGRNGDGNCPIWVDKIDIPMNNISAGDSNSIAYSTSLNILFHWGSYRNSTGKIGKEIEFPKRLDNFTIGSNTIQKVLSGANHTLVLAGKTVYAWGNSEYGQTGKQIEDLKDTTDYLLPSKFSTKNVIDIFTGWNHSFLITIKNKKSILKSWGLNSFGQLGLGHTTNEWIPKEVEFFSGNELRVVSVSGGESHSVALVENGDVYLWGKNDQSQCGSQKRDSEKKLGSGQKDIPAVLPNEAEQPFIKIEEPQPKSSIEAIFPELLQKNDHPAVQEDPILDKENPQILFTPKKIEFFSRDNSVTNIRHFNYARNTPVYSWGVAKSFVLGNKKEENEKTELIPFKKDIENRIEEKKVRPSKRKLSNAEEKEYEIGLTTKIKIIEEKRQIKKIIQKAKSLKKKKIAPQPSKTKRKGKTEKESKARRSRSIENNDMKSKLRKPPTVAQSSQGSRLPSRRKEEPMKVVKSKPLMSYELLSKRHPLLQENKSKLSQRQVSKSKRAETISSSKVRISRAKVHDERKVLKNFPISMERIRKAHSTKKKITREIKSQIIIPKSKSRKLKK